MQTKLAELLLPFDPNELAGKLRVSVQSIYTWQRGEELPRRTRLPDLAKATKLPLSTIREAWVSDRLARKESASA